MPKPPYLFFQGWTKKAERIKCSAPLPEEPAIPLLMKMLVPAPYQALEKKAKKKAKETRSGLRRKGTSAATSEDAETHSSAAEDDEEEEESNSPPEGGRKKRAASINLEAEASKKGKVSLADNSAWDVDSSPERRPRDKPLAGS
jgi:hypothetical protein